MQHGNGSAPQLMMDVVAQVTPCCWPPHTCGDVERVPAQRQPAQASIRRMLVNTSVVAKMHQNECYCIQQGTFVTLLQHLHGQKQQH